MTKFASFDIFDTLICRAVEHPTHVFTIMEKSNLGHVPSGFTEIRETSERVARRRSHSEDVTLREIYAVVGERIGPLYDADAIMQLEIDTELRLSLPRADGIDKMMSLRVQGYRIVGISDMYLPGEVIKNLLQKHGIVLDELYVSNELGLTKATGNLYKKVAEIEGIPLSWIHHGDNFRSDVANAVALGIKAVHTPILSYPLYSHDNVTTTLIEGVVSSVVRSLMYARDGDISKKTWFQVGAQHTGPLSLLLCDLVKRTADRVSADNIFFLARDGYVLKLIYELMFPDDTRRITYLASSRRMINFPLAKDEEGTLEFAARDAVGMTGRAVLGRIGLSPRSSDVAADNKLTNDKQVASFLENYRDEIISAARAERLHVESYLRSSGLLSDNISVIVDVGWLCSMQKNFCRILKDQGLKGTVHGVYFGTNIMRQPELHIEGLFYTGLQASSTVKAIASQVEVMELLFASAEQSIVTVVEEPEGCYSLDRVDNPAEHSRMEAAAGIIEGAVEFAKVARASGLIDLLVEEDAKSTSVSLFKKLCRQPSKEVAICASAVNHSVGFGGSRYESMAPAPFGGRSIHRLLLNYSDCYWRGAFRQLITTKERLILLPFNETTLRWLWYILWRLPKPAKSALKKLAHTALSKLRAN